MKTHKTTKKLAAFFTAALLGGLLGGVCQAAGEDITAWLEQYLTADVASIPLYGTTDSLESLGELVYNDRGELEYVLNREESAKVDSVSLGELSDLESLTQHERRRDEEESESEEKWSVPEGYELIILRLNGMEDMGACMESEYAQSPEQWEAARAAEKAAQSETESSSEDGSGEEESESKTEAALIDAAVAETAAETAEEAGVYNEAAAESVITDKTENGSRKILVAVLLVILAVAAGELAALLKLRNRAENVATNYIRAKAALDRTKKELTVSKSRNVELERQLTESQRRMDAIREQVERLEGRHRPSPENAPSESEQKAAKREKKKLEYDLDYLDWM